jgi:hypothetical protein
MRTPITTIETTGTVAKNRQSLQLDDVLPVSSPKRVRVIVLYEADNQKWDEAEWLQAAANNPAFDFLNDPAEDIYSLSDGKPFYDEV